MSLALDQESAFISLLLKNKKMIRVGCAYTPNSTKRAFLLRRMGVRACPSMSSPSTVTFPIVVEFNGSTAQQRAPTVTLFSLYGNGACSLLSAPARCTCLCIPMAGPVWVCRQARFGFSSLHRPTRAHQDCSVLCCTYS